jgi:hypothetical protein
MNPVSAYRKALDQPSSQNLGAVGSERAIARLVGLACLFGFIVDILVLSFPPAFASLEWRLGLVQQLADRSIILLFSLALLVYGYFEVRSWRRRLSLACLILGISFSLSSVLVIRDSLVLREQAFVTIEERQATVEQQLKDLKNKNEQQISEEQLTQASQAITKQVETLKDNAKNTAVKTGVSSVGNLIIVGVAMIGLSRLAGRSRRS